LKNNSEKMPNEPETGSCTPSMSVNGAGKNPVVQTIIEL